MGDVGDGEPGGVEPAGLVDDFSRMHVGMFTTSTDKTGEIVPPVGFEPTLDAV